MVNSTDEAAIRSMLPPLTTEEQEFLSNLPEEFLIDAPYLMQEQKHWSGSAVVQMLFDFFGIDHHPSQEEIAVDAGWQEYERYNHETLQEKFIRYMAKYNLMPGMYYPQMYVIRHIPSGVECCDFIKGHGPAFEKIDWQYFRALLVAIKTPLLMKLHFTTRQYPMPESVAEHVDTGGHAVLVVGFNREGFIVHDPWNSKKWGGSMGGPNRLVSYNWLTHIPPVNCSRDCTIALSQLQADFGAINRCVYQHRETTLSLSVSLPGISGILADIFSLSYLNVSLGLGGEMKLITTTKVPESGFRLRPGQTVQFEWRIDPGGVVASFPATASVTSSLQIPAYEWEKNSVAQDFVISATGMTRVNVTDKEWVEKFGRYPSVA